MKHTITVAAMILVLFVSGCTTGNVASKNSAMYPLQDDINSFNSERGNLISTLGKTLTKFISLVGNDLDTHTSILSAKDDNQAFQKEIAASHTHISSLRIFLDAWEEKEPSEKTLIFITKVRASLSTFETMLSEAEKISKNYDDYISYKDTDKQLYDLSDNISENYRLSLDYYDDGNYTEALKVIDLVVTDQDARISLLQKQIDTSPVKIDVNKDIIENNKVYQKFYTAVRDAMKKKVDLPTLPKWEPFKNIDTISTEVDRLKSYTDEHTEQESRWLDANVKKPAQRLSDSMVEASNLLNDAYEYIKNNQGGKIVLEEVSGTISL